jgi:hypothetical protein
MRAAAQEGGGITAADDENRLGVAAVLLKK